MQDNRTKVLEELEAERETEAKLDQELQQFADCDPEMLEARGWRMRVCVCVCVLGGGVALLFAHAFFFCSCLDCVEKDTKGAREAANRWTGERRRRRRWRDGEKEKEEEGGGERKRK